MAERLTGHPYNARDAQVRAEALRYLIQCGYLRSGVYEKALAAGEAVVRAREPGDNFTTTVEGAEAYERWRGR